MVVRAVVGGVVGAAAIVAALSSAWTQPTATGHPEHRGQRMPSR